MPAQTEIRQAPPNQTFNHERPNLMDGGHTLHGTLEKSKLQNMVDSGEAVPLEPFVPDNTEAGQRSLRIFAANQERFGGRVILNKEVANEKGNIERIPGVVGTYIDGEVYRRVKDEEAAK